MYKTLFYCFLFLSWNGFSLHAQTSNHGKLYVSPGTKFSTVQTLNNHADADFYNDGQAYIYSGFHNQGTVDYYGQTGKTLFIGTQPQLIDGDSTSYFYNVLFDNTSGQVPFHLAGNIQVDGEADFYNGIVNNFNYNGRFTFGKSAQHVHVADVSFVNGQVLKLGQEEFTFPVGKSGYYRPAAISAPGAPQAQFEGEFIFQNSDPLHSHSLKPESIEAIDNQEYWVLNRLTPATETDMFVTLTWRDVTTPQTFIDAAQNQTLTIVRWDEALNMWVDEGGTVQVSDQTITAKVDGFGMFTLATLIKPLVEPCHVIVYNAVTPNGDGVNDYFRIDNQGDCAQQLHVKIFNRWGVKVFETDNYGPNGDVFDGWSSGRMTIRKSKNQLPTGTYFYILEYQYDNGQGLQGHQQAGYLYLSGN